MDSESHVTEPATLPVPASEETVTDSLENVDVRFVVEAEKVVPDSCLTPPSNLSCLEFYLQLEPLKPLIVGPSTTRTPRNWVSGVPTPVGTPNHPIIVLTLLGPPEIRFRGFQPMLEHPKLPN